MKKHMYIILCIAMLISTLAGCGQNAQSTPTHTTDNRTFVDIEQKCFLIDSTTHEILEQTTFTVEGWLDETGLLDGIMNVDAYPIDLEALQKYEALSQDTSLDSFVIYSCQILSQLDSECNTYYNAFISTSHPDIGVVYIFHNEESLMAVFAESEDEVWDNYNTYLNLYTGKIQ